MNDTTTTTRYTRSDGKVSVLGRWAHRGGCLYLGEVQVFTATGTMRFSSTTPMSRDGLAGYASDEYLARHASKFSGR